VSKLEGPLGTLTMGRLRGTNWPGGSYDQNPQRLLSLPAICIEPFGLVPARKKFGMN